MVCNEPQDTSVVSSLRCVEEVHFCALNFATYAIFCFAQSAPGAPEQSPAQCELSFSFVLFSKSLALTLQQMTVDKTALKQ